MTLRKLEFEDHSGQIDVTVPLAPHWLSSFTIPPTNLVGQLVAGAALVGLVVAPFMLVESVVDPCSVNGRSWAGDEECLAAPAVAAASTQATATLLLLPAVATAIGFAARFIVAPSDTLQIAITGSSVVAREGSRRVFQAKRHHTRIVVENARLVLVDTSTETVTTHRTTCSPIGLRRIGELVESGPTTTT